MRAAPRYLLILVIVGAACDSNVQPFLDDLAPPIHIVDGFLDGSATLHELRVQRLRRTSSVEGAVLNEFTVTSEDRTTGLVTTWRDSIITLGDGTENHLYMAAFSITPGTTYRLTVSDDQGTTQLTTQVPPQPALFLWPIGLTPTVTQTTRLVGQTMAPPKLSVLYVVTVPEDSSQHEFRYTYSTQGRNRVGGWEFDIFLTSDRNRIGSALGRPQNDSLLILNSVSLHFELLSAEWQTLSSTEARSGFFGSVGSYAIDVPLDSTTRKSLNVQ